MCVELFAASSVKKKSPWAQPLSHDDKTSCCHVRKFRLLILFFTLVTFSVLVPVLLVLVSVRLVCRPAAAVSTFRVFKFVFFYFIFIGKQVASEVPVNIGTYVNIFSAFFGHAPCEWAGASGGMSRLPVDLKKKMPWRHSTTATALHTLPTQHDKHGSVVVLFVF